MNLVVGTWVGTLSLTTAGVLSLAALPPPKARFPLPEDSKTLTAEVKKADLPIEVELSGTFVAEDKDEIRVEPKNYRGDLIITQLVAEGRFLKKGDTLIEFDVTTLQDSLEEARDDVTAKEVDLNKAKADLDTWSIETERGEARRRSDLEKAQRELEKAREQAQIDLKDKQKGVEDGDLRIQDAEVDLEQLKQLYKERELHTATENILIERQERQLSDTRRSVEKTHKEFELWMKFDKDTVVRDKDLDLADKEADVRKGDIKAAAERKEKDAAVAKAERALKKAQEKVEKLELDAASLKVASPRDGIVFYGNIGFESPSDIFIVGMDGGNDEMKIGGRVRTHQVLMTVASMERLSVKMRAMEGDIQYLKQGLPITIRPDAFPALAIDGELTKVDQVASRTGFLSDVRQFSVRGTYEKNYPQLRSGMNCRVTVRADSVPDCLQVPVLAVFSESGDHYCWVVDGERQAKRKIKIGASNGTMVEIQEGLRDGERVTLHDPTAS